MNFFDSIKTLQNIPYGALVFRHPRAEEAEDDSTAADLKRPLSDAGRVMAAASAGPYRGMAQMLTLLGLGNVRIIVSEAQRTKEHAYHARAGLMIRTECALNPVDTSVLEGGAWDAKMEQDDPGINAEMNSLILHEQRLQIWNEEDAKRFMDMVTSKEGLSIFFGHEYNWSLLAHRFGVEKELLGLEECEGYVFLFSEDGTIVLAKKVFPWRWV